MDIVMKRFLITCALVCDGLFTFATTCATCAADKYFSNYSIYECEWNDSNCKCKIADNEPNEKSYFMSNMSFLTHTPRATSTLSFVWISNENLFLWKLGDGAEMASFGANLYLQKLQFDYYSDFAALAFSMLWLSMFWWYSILILSLSFKADVLFSFFLPIAIANNHLNGMEWKFTSTSAPTLVVFL